MADDPDTIPEGVEGEEETDQYDQGEYDDVGDDADSEDNFIFGDDGDMNPDHPLLARAQAALKEQLEAARLRLEEELRTKSKALKDARKKREDIGVDLYGVQQQLADLQLQLEKTHENFHIINRLRTDAEEQVVRMRDAHESENVETKQEKSRAEHFQQELDKQAATLKQIEAYNEQMKNEIAVTRRATYKAEENMQKMEKQKEKQDFIIAELQETLKTLHQQLALFTAQTDAQSRETRAALETLTEAEQEMEGIHFEKKQLVQQWKSTLNAIQRRDEALKAIEDAMHEQSEQELSIKNEIDAFKKDITKEQVKNEQLTAVVKKVEGEADYLTKNIDAIRAKQEMLQDMYAKLAKSLEQTEDGIRRAETEGKVLSVEANAVEKAYIKVHADIRAIEDQMLSTLNDQTTVEKSAGKAASDTRDLRKKVREGEIEVIHIQNEAAKLQVDILNTQAHNGRLRDALAALDGELDGKAATIEKYELQIRRRNDEIEKKTREIDVLNRKYERLTANMEDENMGPLEATINNLTREIETKRVEGKDLQRRWITWQTELVALSNENVALRETVVRLRSEHAVMFQKRKRMEGAFGQAQRDISRLDGEAGRLRNDMTRLNGLIAKNSELSSLLENENFNLQNAVVSQLRDAEVEAARLESGVEQRKAEKRDVLSEIIEAERQIALWERKIQLEKEMQDMLDPTVGQDVAGEMRREIHRMKLRLGELQRLQERLISDMERAIAKRDTIGIKGRAMSSKKHAELTEAQLRKALAELNKSVRDTDAEAAATDGRIASLDARRAELADEMEGVSARCHELRLREEALVAETDDAAAAKARALIATSRMQKRAQRADDMAAGQYAPQVSDPSHLDAALSAAEERQARIADVVTGLAQSHPELMAALDRVMLHASVGP